MKTLFITIPKLAAVLSDGQWLRCSVLAVQFWFFVITRKFICPNKSYKMDFVFNDVSFSLHLMTPMDIAVLREIYIEKEYEWFPIENPRVIIDLGAHFGDTTLYYACRFPDAKIIAVEPAPDTYRRLQENTKHNKNITTIQAAIGNVDGDAILHLVPSSLGHSLQERVESLESVSVPQYSLQTLMTKHNLTTVDFIKFDIEGAEFGAFDNPNSFASVAALIGEVHLDLGQASLDDFLKPFSGFEYSVVEISPNKRYLVQLHQKSA